MNYFTILSEESIKKPHQKRARRHYRCLCVCGKEVMVEKQSLKRGLSTNCGCIQNQNHSARLTTHGMTGSRLFAIWSNLLQRCGNPKNTRYERYGGRGIKPSKEWLIFQNFYNDNIDMYSDDLTIERIDNDKGYCKENVTWIPRSQQVKNTSKTVYIVLNGVRHKLLEYCENNGLDLTLIRVRVNRGWKHEDAVSLPKHAKMPK